MNIWSKNFIISIISKSVDHLVIFRVPQDITCLDDCYFFVPEAPLSE